ncbi:MAG: hypothetical protein JXA03_10910 [Bacteroidales bacterium]|nr:hypothetical protein [Bacteroidales bacterium]
MDKTACLYYLQHRLLHFVYVGGELISIPSVLVISFIGINGIFHLHCGMGCDIEIRVGCSAIYIPGVTSVY